MFFKTPINNNLKSNNDSIIGKTKDNIVLPLYKFSNKIDKIKKTREMPSIKDIFNQYKNNIKNNIHDNKFKVLVLGGGSMRGISHIGVIKLFEEIGIMKHIDTFCGVSIGALICALLVLGYESSVMFDFISNFNFEKLKKIEPKYLFTLFGIDKGKNVEQMIKQLIKEKIGDENIILSKLFKMTKKTLIITVTCLNNNKEYYFDHNNAPDMPLYLLIQMSMCIPIMYTPILYKGNYYIDGGCKNNYPISIFKDRIHETIGVCLYVNMHMKNDTMTFENYITKLIFCLLSNSSKDMDLYRDNTIIIETNGVGIIDFQMKKSKKLALFTTGYNSAKNSPIIRNYTISKLGKKKKSY